MLPPEFSKNIHALLGEQEGAALLDAIEHTAPPTSVRLNPLKPCAALPAAVEAAVPWAENGRYLTERPRFTYDPLLHAGCYYVQEAASMFVEEAWKKMAVGGEAVRFLDLCAAPGGKSTLWRSLLPDGALLVANEPIRQRAHVLAENLTKWGHPDVVVTNAYPEEFAPLVGFFDIVAADVPCSGEGMFRKDRAAVDEWTAESPALCAARQWDIVSAIWPTLRTGGYLVYSTCTFNAEENEENVVRICRELGAELVPIATDPAWGITGDTTGRGLPVYHFFPHHARGEGFFLALLRKTADTPTPRCKNKNKGTRARAKEPGVRSGAELASWLRSPDDFSLVRTDEEHVVALRRSFADDAQRVCQTVHALAAGILLVEEKGKKRIPQHALALSTELSDTAFPRAELSLDEALRYLRREALTLPPETPRGYVVVTHQGHPLGFVNNLGARANNLYPQEWRIRN